MPKEIKLLWEGLINVVEALKSMSLNIIVFGLRTVVLHVKVQWNSLKEESGILNWSCELNVKK